MLKTEFFTFLKFFLSILYKTTFVTLIHCYYDSSPTYGFTYVRLTRLLTPAECNAETNFWKILR